MGARSSRPLPSASRRRVGSTRYDAPNGEWNLPHQLFGETPNRATGTVALPFSDCIVPAKGAGGNRGATKTVAKSRGVRSGAKQKTQPGSSLKCITHPANPFRLLKRDSYFFAPKL